MDCIKLGDVHGVSTAEVYQDIKGEVEQNGIKKRTL
jgi:hypothetical protein